MPYADIVNTAMAAFEMGSGHVYMQTSNTVSTHIESRSKSVLEFLVYSPFALNAEEVPIAPAEFSPSGHPDGPFITLPPPKQIGSLISIDLTKPVPLVPVKDIRAGEPLFIRLTDPDQNQNPSMAEEIIIIVSVSGTSESGVVRLTETGPNIGVFTGYIQTVKPGSAVPEGCLKVAAGSHISTTYTDAKDGTDTSASTALADPFGRVFDGEIGLGINGVKITLINMDTGKDAEVFGDDGFSPYPSSVITGGTVSDKSGRTYEFEEGGYRFPFAAPGHYRLQVEPPARFTFPSKVSAEMLQNIPNAPFEVVQGSRGETFEIIDGPPLFIDIPVDLETREVPETMIPVWLDKTAGKLTVSPGEFLPYTIKVTNNSGVRLDSVFVTDILPKGFRLQKESAKTDNGDPIPAIVGPDGRTVTFFMSDMKPKSSANFTYVVKVPAGAKPGRSLNTASALTAGGYGSNVVRAEVQIVDDLFRSTSILMGSVIADSCGVAGSKPSGGIGIKGVRIYLEDGTYTVSDEKGMFHFEGIRPGVHILQLDMDSLPEQYEVVPCEQSSRFSGRAYSQFVDLQGGSLWKSDFHVALKPRMKGEVRLTFMSALSDSTVDYTLRMEGGGVPLVNISLSVLLPDSSFYIPGTSMMDGKAIPDPAIMGTAILYRLEDAGGDWAKEIRFRTSVPLKGEIGELITKGLLTFSTPTETNMRTPVVDNVLLLLSKNVLCDRFIQVKKDTDSTRVETTGLRPGEKIENEKTLEGEKETTPNYDMAWLASAKPGFEILWPTPEYSPPIASLKFAVKHDPKQKITLILDGKPVHQLKFEGMDKNEPGTVVVSRWIGVDIHEGDNQFSVVSADSTGKEIVRLVRKIHYSGPPVHIELIEEKSVLVADGRTTPVIAVRMTDKDGYPGRSGVTGTFTLDKPYSTLQELEKNRSRAINGFQTDNHYVIGKGGIAYIELQPTTRSGEAMLRFQFTKSEIRAWLKPEARDWVLVGLAENTIGYNTVTGNMENLDDSDIHDNYYDNGRIAFFAKGKVKGSWLMTLSYDTARNIRGTGDNLFRTIDPDEYYTLYGDAAEQNYDAASTKKLYLKIDHSQFYALFGVYNTGLTFTELSRYNRTFNGLKSEINTDRYGVNVFANETGQSFVKDEILGDGTSGLYRLSRRNILVNSEKIIIETRDRFRSEVILKTRSLTRHIDYNIDYDACTMFFKEPVMSKDENLNPIFIVVDYETGATTGESYNYGGRGSLKLMNRNVEIGSTYLHESTDGASENLIGADATVKMGLDWEFKGELAQTSSGADKKGSAYIAELTRRSGKLDGRMYIREITGKFGLGQQSAGEMGTRKLGLDASYRFSQMFTMNQQLYRQYNLDRDGIRDLAEAKLNYSGNRYSTSLGLRHAEDRVANNKVNRSEQISLGGGVRMFSKKLQFRISHDQTLGGNNANADFPTRTTAGVDYDILKSATLFAEQELTSGEKEDSQGTRVGVKTRPWNGAQINTSVERNFSENSERLFANLGLRQSLYVTKKITADLGLDRSQSFRHPGNTPFNATVPPASGTNNDFTALSLGANYHEETWSWTSRIETRSSDTDHKWGIMSGVYGEPREGLGLSGSTQILRTSFSAGNKQNSGNIRLGLVHRQKNSRWIVLNRLDLIQENSTAKKSDLASRRIVNNMNTNYEVSSRTQLSFQYVSKYVLDTVNTDEYIGYQDIFGIEMRNFLTKRFDFGIRGSILHSWDASQFDYNTGLSIGFNILENIWLSAGYNFHGYEDRDFSKGNFTAQGPYLQFRTKFDQNTIRDALMLFGRTQKDMETSGKI